MSNVEQSSTNSTGEQISKLDTVVNEIFGEPPETTQPVAEAPVADLVSEEAEEEVSAESEVISEVEEPESEESQEEEPQELGESNEFVDDEVVWMDDDGNEITRKTAKDQQMLHSDYTKKRQKEAAEHREALESLTEKEQRLDWDLQIMADAAKAGLNRWNGVDWKALQAQDPAAYQEQSAEYAKALSGVEYAEKARAERLEAFGQEKEARRQREASNAVAVLKEAIPEWSTEYYATLGESAAKAGLPIETFNEITDPNLIMLIRKGLELDKIKSKDTKKISKRVKKTLQAKAGQSKEKATAKRSAENLRQFKKTGRPEDLANSDFFDSFVQKYSD